MNRRTSSPRRALTFWLAIPHLAEHRPRRFADRQCGIRASSQFRYMVATRVLFVLVRSGCLYAVGESVLLASLLQELS